MLNRQKILFILGAAMSVKWSDVHAVFEDDFDKVADQLLGTPAVVPAKWITFAVTGSSESGKTHIYQVRTKTENPVLLGEIKWEGHFRSYAFFPQPNTVYEPQCLNDITNFIESLMFLRKKKPADKS